MTVKSCEKLEKSMVALTIEVGAEAFETAVNKALNLSKGLKMLRILLKFGLCIVLEHVSNLNNMVRIGSFWT